MRSIVACAVLVLSLTGCQSWWGSTSSSDASLASEYETAERESRERQYPTRDEIDARRAEIAARHAGR